MAKKSDAILQADAIREQIATLQTQLAETEKQARLEALALMKDMQKQYRFSVRELGNLFKHRRRGRTEE